MISKKYESLKKLLQENTSILLHLSKYNIGFHYKNIISKYPNDQTLNLDFNMLQQNQGTLMTPVERDKKNIIRSKGDKCNILSTEHTTIDLFFEDTCLQVILGMEHCDFIQILGYI
jgi:hypothetical protein